jgi:hypothetical protein
MSKQAEAELILKLYDLRREPVMRTARDWFFRECHPQSMADLTALMFSEHGAHMRMVTSYWDMAAALVNHGAISPELFRDVNGEHIIAFSRIEPFLPDLRAMFGPFYLTQLEKLIDSTPGERERVAESRERLKAFREMAAKRQSA